MMAGKGKNQELTQEQRCLRSREGLTAFQSSGGSEVKSGVMAHQLLSRPSGLNILL